LALGKINFVNMTPSTKWYWAQKGEWQKVMIFITLSPILSVSSSFGYFSGDVAKTL
jgi:hypothetical protein